MQGIINTVANSLRPVFLILFFLLPTFYLSAQQNFYDTDLLTPEFHQARRDALRKLLPPNSCAVLFSNPVRNRSNDVDFQYSQDPDIYYLSGLTEPHAMLIIFDSVVISNQSLPKEILFIQPRDSANEIWNGKRLGREGAIEKLGIKSVILNTYLIDSFPDLKNIDKILVKYPKDIKESKSPKNSLNSMVYHFREMIDKAGKETNTAALLKSMATLREIKLPEELVLLQKAVDITIEGLAEVIRAAKPGITEYQAQAIVEFYFKHRGSEYPGYGSISGGGENTCVLHYVTNRKKLSDGDLLLMDMGAEYHGYTADVTRTIPVNGKFSPEQKAIYDLVLEAQLEGIKKAIPAHGFYDPHKAALEVISKGLVKLGIIKEESQARKYFNHGTSHYLGLEVHDPGNYGPLKKGMVITVEPGIYIPEGSKCDKKWWNIGVRIEDDILITDNEPFVMSGKLAKTTADIEKLMEEESLFNKIK